MTSGPQLERSLLETKERDELQMIAQAMELKTSARASKATLIGAILDATGVAADVERARAAVDEVNVGYRIELQRRWRGVRRRRARGRGHRPASPSADGRPGTDERRPGRRRPGRLPFPAGSRPQSGASPQASSTRRTDATTAGAAAVTATSERGDRDLQGSQEQSYTGELVEVRGLLDLRDEGYGFVRTSWLPAVGQGRLRLDQQAKRFCFARATRSRARAGPRRATRSTRRSCASTRHRPRSRRGARRAALRGPHAAVPRRAAPARDGRRRRTNMTSRIVDLLSPIGKGQRGLIVSPPKAGKTAILKRIAHSIEENNPEVHLMVLLVEERPEEVTDMRRSVQRRGRRLDVRPPERGAHARSPSSRSSGRSGSSRSARTS